ncbi:hypothetical protein TraAM80_06679 [Trypanosoma rangeli]|uniref:LicD/FKTN/FKRP nucleotidyltransferase domain-containing protein n=1 Tax=Trypanosoma rangeli TaxID=5698 RepID=A0A422N9B2_TRYRA|nr:uncharacterized protein TraAM80_06679 [Trypanosoma rangeli]RNF02050.1 hypothetical protein TraAM80_06679 [Trypanosoma rangeli]|eukprot:RNF02050.1 hypothetical protein TraAM80_06679 [Trypanosoma rangeli]
MGGKGVKRAPLFTRILRRFFAICFLLILVPLLTLIILEHASSPSSTTMAPHIQRQADVLNGEGALERGAKTLLAGYGGGDEDGTLVPLSEIPPSPYFSFDSRIMPPKFLRSLQNASRRINKKWISSKLNRYDKVDISDCDTVTPECALHKYLLKRGVKDPNQRPYRKCCVEHKALRETTVWVIRKLKFANITYFLSTGTALGARRHAGAIIPWDTDVDIAVYPNDRSRVEELFCNNGEHYFRKDLNGKPMFWIYESESGKPQSGPHVEIFYDPVYTRFPHLLLPLEGCFFYDEPATCPSIKQFEEWFPSGWNVYSGGHYNGPKFCVVRENGIARVRRRC